MDNPYQAPRSGVEPTEGAALTWRRVIGWSVVILLLANLIGFGSGLTMSRWGLYGDTLHEVIDNARFVRRLVLGIVAVFFYWHLAATARSRPALHVAAVFVAVYLLDMIEGFILSGFSFDGLFDVWALGRSLLAALVGLGIALVGRRSRNR